MTGYVATSMPWIDECDYEAFRTLMSDGNTLPVHYEEWRSHVQRRIDMFAAQGHAMVKVKIDPNSFVAWCRASQIPVSANSCQLYASALLASSEKNG